MAARTLEKEYDAIVRNTKKYFSQAGIKKAVVGVSGGVDSALTLKILVDALGRKNVLALVMPERGLTKKENTRDATEWCNELGVRHHLIYINRFIRPFISHKWKSHKKALMNAKSRMRMALLYYFANTNNALVAGTSNKTEIMLGYFTKYGDGGVDLEVIGSLYKTEVYDVARMKGIPESILSKKPSAELTFKQTDERELGISYEEADAILKEFEKKKNWTKVRHKKKKIVQKLFEQNAHKRSMPPVMKRK
ncbi:NAD+ synthase [Candidatus Woesearchaeota archaeon]|nr:MAG: NAD+ synthase [Candidatus Woesearchaeota archaeon]